MSWVQVHGFGSHRALRRLRDTAVRQPPAIVPPKLRRRTTPYFEPRVQRYSVPFPGSDATVVRRLRPPRSIHRA